VNVGHLRVVDVTVPFIGFLKNYLNFDLNFSTRYDISAPLTFLYIYLYHNIGFGDTLALISGFFCWSEKMGFSLVFELSNSSQAVSLKIINSSLTTSPCLPLIGKLLSLPLKMDIRLM